MQVCDMQVYANIWASRFETRRDVHCVHGIDDVYVVGWRVNERLRGTCSQRNKQQIGAK